MATYIEKIEGSLIKDTLYSVILILVWKLIVHIFSIFTFYRLALSDVDSEPLFPLSIYSHWDGGQFLGIAQGGYQGVQYAFFPLFPLLIKIFAYPFIVFYGDQRISYLYAGIVVSTLAMMGAVYFLIQLGKFLMDMSAAKRAVLLLLFFPSAIFLASIYSETLFLFFASGSFYFAKNKRWFLASIFGSLAALTRFVGVGLAIPLLIEFMIIYKGKIKKNLFKAFYLLLIPLGTSAYCGYLYFQTGNAWAFLASWKAWEREIGGNAVIRLINDFLNAFEPTYFYGGRMLYLYDSLAFVIFLGLTIILWKRKYYAYAVYSLIMLLTPLASGQIAGEIRYVLVIFPVFLLLGKLTQNQTVFGLLLATLAVFWAVLSISFINIFWLA